ncbi:hypothetical protein NQ317_002940 [Molorchus minor]|uniref:Uncharacterized protein n=1 Tax=Molorchus minor TaxID=1323400 RepID=A0ABQ9J2Q3_9CUCU|nr:hypothetical protein NQ317_002940 [Molorchus minor]
MVVAILGKGDLVGSDINMHLQHCSNGTANEGGRSASASDRDIVIKSSSDVRALTYCDLKCINMQGLVDVLRLYPEYQQQFANDIQHDLTFNVREGYEAEAESDGNGMPSLTLPSISEDDENAHEGETSPASPNRSPIHQLSNSPRHAKFNLRLQDAQETVARRPRMGGIATNHLAMLRERVERQRSVVISHQSKTNSLEDLNCELKNDVENTRNSVDKLDSQISTLHQDVATLSLEVRNAIQALQEMTTPTSMVGTVNYSAHSNPNIAHLHHSSSDKGMLARSNSHPPEMFCWEAPPSPSSYLPPIATFIDTETQTDSTDAIRQYVLQNPKTILEMLGLDAEKVLNRVSLKKSYSIPDYTGRGRGYQGVDCYVDVDADEVEENEETKREDCPFLWNNEERRVQIFESLNVNKGPSSLLKFRRNNLD